jgi:hypothetical protein
MWCLLIENSTPPTYENATPQEVSDPRLDPYPERRGPLRSKEPPVSNAPTALQGELPA